MWKLCKTVHSVFIHFNFLFRLQVIWRVWCMTNWITSPMEILKRLSVLLSSMNKWEPTAPNHLLTSFLWSLLVFWAPVVQLDWICAKVTSDFHLMPFLYCNVKLMPWIKCSLQPELFILIWANLSSLFRQTMLEVWQKADHCYHITKLNWTV